MDNILQNTVKETLNIHQIITQNHKTNKINK